MKFTETVSAVYQLPNMARMQVIWHKGSAFVELRLSYEGGIEGAVVIAPKLKELDEFIGALQEVRELLVKKEKRISST